MSYGLSGLALGDTTSAIDGFSMASASVAQRSAAYNAISSLSLSRGEYLKALGYAENSLNFNQLGSDAVQLRILSLRKLGFQEKAEIELSKLELRDPLNHFIRFERYLNGPSEQNKITVQNHITGEMPQETYLEYGLWYFHNGQYSDALKILDLAPQDQPIVLLWKSSPEPYYGEASGGNPKLLAKATDHSPQLVFPFRIETLILLEWAGKLSDNRKINYYSGLIFLNAGMEDKTRDLWDRCGDKPDFYPFYIEFTTR